MAYKYTLSDLLFNSCRKETESSPFSWRPYNTIQILLSTPHEGFSETSINSTGNQKKIIIINNNNNKKKLKKKQVSQIDYQ